MKSMISAVIAAAALLSTPAQSVVGEQHRTITQPSAKARDAKGRTDLRVTIWYPAKAGSAETSIDVGAPGAPRLRRGSVAMDAPFADEKRHPVIMLSHGFGGAARPMAWFGKAMAERGYVVVGVDHPGNNGIDKMTVPGAVLWWERAEDLKAALAAVRADKALSRHIDPARVGVAGFSIGGLTALIAGGARVSPENIMAFCDSHPRDGVCQPQIEFAVSPRQWQAAFESEALRDEVATARDDHSLPGVRAVFAMAPVVQVADPASLKAMRVPVSIISGAEDATVPPATHARVAQTLIPGATLELIPDGTHYSFLAECTAAGREQIPVCKDAAVQEETHRRAIAAAAALFDKALR